ncbi:GSCOCT00002162001.2-RA-CDS [Cotesia congregata]|uniref:CYP6AQ22 n=1 Tax=Cotesia congregata TaxID=51543 RepID=A0A8J2HNQ4_COTCN|nr:GSCOCT00002162001.2-RA-CDS [Cotesia congregata]CAG5104047.1 CYP6AQ22 [Cotesia congregata]
MIDYKIVTMAFFTKYWMLDILIIVFGLTVAAYLYMTRKFKYWKKLGVVEIPPTAFVGNYGECLMSKKNPGEWLKEIYDEGSGLPYIGFYVFDRPFFLVRNPKLVKQVLVKDFNCFNDRFLTASPHDSIGDANLFSIKNPRWKLLRSKLTPIYTSGRLKKMFELMTVVGDELEAFMESLNFEEKGKTLELKDLCARFTTDLISTTAFGIKTNCLKYPDAEFRKKGRRMFETTMIRNFEISTLFFAPQFATPCRIKFVPEENTKFFRKTVWDVIAERERSGETRGDFIDLLMELRKNKAKVFEDKLDFDGDMLVAQTIVFFNAGFEPTSSSLSFTLYELALQPEIQDRVRAEIVEGLEGTDGKVTYNLITSLPYLDMVIAETLRMYPTLPFLDRVPNQNYQVPDSDLVLEKGTPVLISVRGLHFDPQYFPNPEKYNPERFSETNKKMIPPCTYLPFGDGPHNCIGMRIGLLQVKLGLIKLLSKYEFTPCEETLIPMRLSPKALFIVSEGGVYLNVKKIS